MGSVNQSDDQKPLPWWKRWNTKRFNWWLKLIFWLLLIGGLIYVIIPGVSGLINQLSGAQVKP